MTQESQALRQLLATMTTQEEQTFESEFELNKETGY